MFIELGDREERERRLRRIRKGSMTVQTGNPPVDPPSQPVPSVGIKRGVYEEEIHPPGEHWYKVVTSLGHIAIVHLPDELWDQNTADNLRRRLDAKDPVQPNLKAI